MKVFNDLKTRGAVFPQRTLQTRNVHLIRSSLNYANRVVQHMTGKLKCIKLPFCTKKASPD
jgi:transposase-like protein